MSICTKIISCTSEEVVEMAVPKKVYESLARQIIEDYGIVDGRCLDVGAGKGSLGIEIVKRSNLRLYLLDINSDVLAEAENNFKQQGMAERTTIIKAAVEELPFVDDYFDIIVSRGSIFFWQDISRGLQEIYRVLKPGKVAFVGGGASRLMTEREIEDFFEWARPLHRKHCKDWDKIGSEKYLQERLVQAGISNYKIHTGYGTWIEMEKESAVAAADTFVRA
jgi:SAM-dependent methyltransferase